MDIVDKEKAVRAALNKFSEERWHCAESVLYGILKAAGYDNPEIPLSCASGFSGGIGGSGSVCGAVSGAVIAAGFLFGRHGVKKQNMDLCKNISGNVMEEFKKELGTSVCSELTAEYDFNSAERRNCCRNMIETSIKIICELLNACRQESNEVSARI